MLRFKSRRNRSANAVDAGQADDGLDTADWKLLRDAATAAHQGDSKGHMAALLRLERDVPCGCTAASS
jgi:hypothetical protein